MESIKAILERFALGKGRAEWDEEAAKAVCIGCRGTEWRRVRGPRPGEPGFGELYPCPVCHPLPGPTFREFQPYNRDLNRGLASALAWLDEDAPGILVLAGTVGVGKTHLAWAAYREVKLAVMKRGREGDAIWRTHGDLVQAIHMGFRDTDAMSDLVQGWKSAPYYVVDDLGVAAEGEAVRGMMDQFIDCRWAGVPQGLRTVITTNLAPSDFSPRMASRLRDEAYANVVVINADDYRMSNDRREHAPRGIQTKASL